MSTALLAIVLAAALGAALAIDPLLSALVVGTILISFALLLAPEWMLATALVSAMVVAAVFASYLRTGGASDAQVGMLGLGRITIVIVLIAAARLALDRRAAAVPRGVLLVVVAFAASIVLAAVVALLRDNGGAGLLEDVRREFSYMAAFVIGLVAVVRVPERRMFRSLAVLLMLAAASTVYYWAWLQELVAVPPIVEHVFSRMLADAPIPTRVNFPFAAHHPNSAAALYVLLAALVIPLLVRSKSRGDLVLALATIALVTAAVLTTQSRTGLIALATLPVLFFLLLRDLAGGRRVVILVGVTAVGLFAFGALQAFPEGRAFSDSSTVDTRQQIWQDAMKDVAEAPLLGHGHGVAQGGRYGGLSVHNEYLGWLVDGGLVGATITGALFMVFLWIGLELRRREGAASDFGVGMLVFCVALMITMLTNETWQVSSVAVLFWMSLGIGSGALVAGSEVGTPSAPRTVSRSGQG